MLTLAPVLDELARDERLMTALEEHQKANAEKKPLFCVLGRSAAKVLPLLLGDHRNALTAIVAALEGVSAEEVGRMSGKTVVKSFLNGFSEEIYPFFLLAASLA